MASKFRLSTVILHVGDVATLDACRDWYSRLGLPMTSESPGESYWFDAGSVLLGVHTGEATPSTTVYFDVDDLNATYEGLTAAGFAFETPPAPKSWGGTVAYVRDPAGYQVGIVAWEDQA